MKISQIAQSYGVELHKAAGNKAVTKPEKARKADSVSVSKEGKVLNNSAASVDTTSKRIQGLPEIRQNRVDEVKERIRNGFYNTSEFRQELADKLIKDFGLEAPPA